MPKKDCLLMGCRRGVEIKAYKTHFYNLLHVTLMNVYFLSSNLSVSYKSKVSGQIWQDFEGFANFTYEVKEEFPKDWSDETRNIKQVLAEK